MTKKQIQTFFERLREQRPNPTTELNFSNPFELLIAVTLSAQATDVSVNGGTVVVKESYTSDDQDFSAIISKAKDANPDILYLPDYYSTVNLIAAQAREKGMTAVFMGGDGWDSPDLDEAALEGGYFTNHYSPEDPRPEVQDFVKKYQAKYGSVPDALATLAYDAATVLLKGIEQAGTADPVAVAKAIEGGVFPVVSSEISYDTQHNPVKAAAMLQVTGGVVKYVATIEP